MDPDGIVERLARAAVRAERGDADLNPDMAPMRDPLTRAAVLVPIVCHAGAPTMLLTQRQAHLTDHAGQISFPGGRIESFDADATAAALRETEEEVGIPPARVRIVGTLDRYVTRTGFDVTPVVGLIDPPAEPKPDPGEVAEAFEVPLPFLLDRRNHLRHARTFEGRRREFFAMPYGTYYIWGATAGMIVNLADVLGAIED